MGSFLDKLKEVALEKGREAQKNPRYLKAAQNIKLTVDSFKQGYREQMEPEKYQLRCPHCQEGLPDKAKFCPNCGAKID